jgi:hypothetical protein
MAPPPVRPNVMPTSRSLAARRRRSERTPRIEWLPSLNHPSASSACDPRGRTLGTARLQVGRQPVPGRQQFPFVHDVVAIEHSARFVAREQHGDPLRHPGADQVPRRGASTIVEQTMGHARPATGVAQRGAPDAHRHAVAVKHARIAGLPPRATPIQHCRNGARSRPARPLFGTPRERARLRN